MRIERFGLLLAIAFGAFGQTEKPAAEWIRSGEPLKQAWAAHWIAEQGTESLVPELLRVLADPLPIGDSAEVADAEAARLAILDTLIQMHQSVPLTDLAPYVQKFPTEVLILASRSHEDNSALLLKLLDRPHNYAAFIAIGDLLTPRRDSGFALRALQEFDVSDEIMVFNRDQDQNISSGWAGDSLGERVSERVGWPEIGLYTFTVTTPTIPHGASPASRRMAPPRDELIGDGRYRVSVNRQPGKTYVDHCFQDYGSEKGRTIPDRAQEFLADYLEIDAAQLPVHAAETFKITWGGDADFRARVIQFFAGQRVGYAALVQALIGRKYISAEQAMALQLHIRPLVEDQRVEERTELPDVQALVAVR